MSERGDRRHILLVDDDAVLRAMAAQALDRAGFIISEVGDGESGLGFLAKTPVDLVLLDVVMPGIDGFEVCRRLRATPGGENLPVVMLTGLDDSDSIERAYQSGASDFIVKPINWNLLIHRVRFNLRAASVRAELAASRRSLDSAQRLARMGNWEWWPHGGGFSCSSELARLFALDAAVLQAADPLALTKLALEADREALHAARSRALEKGKAYQIRYAYRAPTGSEHVFEESGQASRGPGGEVIKVEAIVRDVTEAVANEERVRFLSYHDVATGLPTRQFFHDVAAHSLEQARRAGSRCALLFIDLDHFKEINLQHGSERGDVFLRIMADRVVRAVRSAAQTELVHTPEGIEVAARAGGDQFLVLLSQLRRETDASTVADRILQAIREPVQLDEGDAVITACIGLALFPRDGEDVATLIEHAEQATYGAQRRGRDCFAFYNEDVGQVASAKLHLEGELRQAIARDEMRLHYQPKVHLPSGRIVGAEALVRWQHPERGLLLPGEFIPLAEESGLILALGHNIFQMACDQIAAWRSRGLVRPEHSFAVNLSALSFMEEDLLEQLTAVTAQRGIPHGHICLEVTETSLMHDVDSAGRRLDALRRAGFRIALDDFGTGYSSLNYLKRFPIDCIKIDRSFIQDMTRDEQDVAIVGTIVTLAGRLGLTVVAEGVETAEQAALLQGLGCTTAQGYYFARPLPAEAMEALLALP